MLQVGFLKRLLEIKAAENYRTLLLRILIAGYFCAVLSLEFRWILNFNLGLSNYRFFFSASISINLLSIIPLNYQKHV